MRRLLTVALSLLFLVALAPPAFATAHGERCETYEHGTGVDHQKIKVCVGVNIHDALGWKEAYVDIDVLDSDVTHAVVQVFRDYLRLYKNGNIPKANNWDSDAQYCDDFCTYTDHSHWSTDWLETDCAPAQPNPNDYWGSFRFKIRWWGEGTYGTWKNISSDVYSVCH